MLLSQPSPAWTSKVERRYTNNWANPCEYLGGFERFDLFVDSDRDLRITWGNSDFQWHYIERGRPHFSLSDLHAFEPLHDPPTRADLNRIKRYLKLFCPDFWAELDIGKKTKAVRDNPNRTTEGELR